MSPPAAGEPRGQRRAEHGGDHNDGHGNEHGDEHGIVCHLDVLLEDRGMTLKQLSEAVGVTVVNLSVLKNNRARAVRFTTLAALCAVLDCQPGDLFGYRPARAGGDGPVPS